MLSVISCPSVFFCLPLKPSCLPSSPSPPNVPMDSFPACSLTHNRLKDPKRKGFLSPRRFLGGDLRKEAALQRHGMTRWLFLPLFMSMDLCFPASILLWARVAKYPLEHYPSHSVLCHAVRGLPKHGPTLEGLEAPVQHASEPRSGRTVVRQLLQCPTLWITYGIVPVYSPSFFGAWLEGGWFYIRNLEGGAPVFISCIASR